MNLGNEYRMSFIEAGSLKNILNADFSRDDTDIILNLANYLIEHENHEATKDLSLRLAQGVIDIVDKVKSIEGSTCLIDEEWYLDLDDAELKNKLCNKADEVGRLTDYCIEIGEGMGTFGESSINLCIMTTDMCMEYIKYYKIKLN